MIVKHIVQSSGSTAIHMYCIPMETHMKGINVDGASKSRCNDYPQRIFESIDIYNHRYELLC